LDLPEGVITADAGYGVDAAFRRQLSELGLTYIVGVQSSVTVWRPGEQLQPPCPWSGRGRPPRLLRRPLGHAPLPVRELALALPAAAY